jgi:uncharacterized membrane protein
MRRGVRLAAPLVPAAVALGASFGVLARTAHFDVVAAVLMSATTFAGSARVAAVSVLGAGGGVAAAVVAALLLNARYAPIGISVAAHSVRAVRCADRRRHRCCARRLEALVSTAWEAVIAVGAGTVVLKAVGPVGVAGRRLPARMNDLLEMVAPAILAGLVVSEAFASGRSLVVDARVAGLAV